MCFISFLRFRIELRRRFRHLPLIIVGSLFFVRYLLRYYRDDAVFSVGTAHSRKNVFLIPILK